MGALAGLLRRRHWLSLGALALAAGSVLGGPHLPPPLSSAWMVLVPLLAGVIMYERSPGHRPAVRLAASAAFGLGTMVFLVGIFAFSDSPLALGIATAAFMVLVLGPAILIGRARRRGAR